MGAGCRLAAFWITAVLAAGGCSSGTPGTPGRPGGSAREGSAGAQRSSPTAQAVENPAAVPTTLLRVTSPAFADGGTLPNEFTCSGSGISPPLQWTSPPRGTLEIAVIVDDPDAPGGTFVHWILTGLDPSRHLLQQGERPAGSVVGPTSIGQRRYVPPCPPVGTRHRYRFTVAALGRHVTLGNNALVAETMLGRAAVAQGTLIAWFNR